MKTISIVARCYNEAENIRELYDRVVAVMLPFKGIAWTLYLGDNGSTDATWKGIKHLAIFDPRVKGWRNARNFGASRGGYSIFLNAPGDAVVGMASDLQDPPELIADFIRAWEAGADLTVGVKRRSHGIMRRIHYWLMGKLSDTPMIPNFIGFGLYSRTFMEALKRYGDSTTYFRGVVSDVGMRRTEILFDQPPRKRGKTSNNFFTLYDASMKGVVAFSMLPLRLATLAGFGMAALGLLIAVFYGVYKLLHWDTFTMGMAPVLMGMFLFSAVQLIVLGIVGEYIGAILMRVRDYPDTIVAEKVNWEKTP